MYWKIGEAKQRLSQVVRASAEAPQQIYNRDRLVAAVDSPRDLDILERHRQHEARSLADLVAEASSIAPQSSAPGEAYSLETPRREDRPNPLTDLVDGR